MCFGGHSLPGDFPYLNSDWQTYSRRVLLSSHDSRAKASLSRATPLTLCPRISTDRPSFLPIHPGPAASLVRLTSLLESATPRCPSPLLSQIIDKTCAR